MKLEKAASLNFKKNIIERIGGFRAYSNEIEVKFEKDIHSLAERYGLIDEENICNGEQIMKVILSDEYRNISEIFIETYRSSTLVSIYSFLENTMRSFCKILHAINCYPIELHDLAGDGVQRSKTYLEKMAKIDFNEINGVWANIQNLNVLRNCIVHAEGDTLNFRNEEKIRNIVAGNKHLYLRRDRSIVVDREYIDLIINEVEACIIFMFSRLLHC